MCGWIPSITREYVTQCITSPGRDHNFKSKVQFLLNVYHFRITIMSKDPVWKDGLWKWSESCSVVSDSLSTPWNSPGQNTGVGSLSLQGISPTQGSNPGLPPDSLPAELRGKPLKGPYLLPNFLGEKAKMSPLVAVMVVAGLESGGVSLLKQAQFSCSVVSDSLWANRSIPGLPVHH